MYSTKQEPLRSITDLLRNAGIPANRLVDETSLLVAWAKNSFDTHGDISWHEQQPDLRYAFLRMAELLGESGGVFKNSNLPERLSGAEVESVRVELTKLSALNQKTLAENLLILAEKHGHPGHMINADTGAFLAALGGSGQEPVMFHHEASIAGLVPLEAPEATTVTLRSESPLAIAVSFILGTECRVEGLDPFENSVVSTEFVISVPPLQATGFSETSKLKSDELAVLRVARECTSRGVICVAPSVLFSRASMSIREELINNNWLDAVIGLPSGTLSNTAVPPVILVINKHREIDSPIIFVEVPAQLSREEIRDLALAVRERGVPEHGAFSSNLDVQKNDYDLTISRYKPGLAAQQLKRLKNIVSLEGVADIVRAQSLKDAEDDPDATTFLEASVRDIMENGCLGTPVKQMRIDKTQFRRAQNQRIYPGDILLAIKGSVGRVAFVDETCGDNWIAGQAFIIIRPQSSSPGTPYLYRYLASELVQAYIQEVATGGVMALLKAADVSGIPVPLPEPDSLTSVLESHQQILAEYEVIKKHRDTVRRLELKNWPLNAEKGDSRV